MNADYETKNPFLSAFLSGSKNVPKMNVFDSDFFLNASPRGFA